MALFGVAVRGNDEKLVFVRIFLADRIRIEKVVCLLRPVMTTKELNSFD